MNNKMLSNILSSSKSDPALSSRMVIDETAQIIKFIFHYP